MTRQRGRANGRTGLWQDTPSDPYVPAADLPPELTANPLSVACPWQPCKAPIRRTCVNHRGKPRTPHPGRITAANKPPPEPNPSEPETRPQEPK